MCVCPIKNGDFDESGLLSGEVDDGDAGAAEADVFVMGGLDAGAGAQELAYGLTQGAGAGAVEDADASLGELDGVVDEVHCGLDGLVGAHAADVDFGLEGELLLAQFLGGGGGDEGGGLLGV